MMRPVTAETLDKVLLPFTTAGILSARYEALRRITYYINATTGEIVASSESQGRHYAKVTE